MSEGLEGVTVAESSLTHIDGDQGRLVYRGVPIEEFAEHGTYEEVVKFLWDGSLPTESELQTFQNELRERYELNDRLLQLIEQFPKDALPMDVLRTIVSTLGTFNRPDTDVHSEEGQREIALQLVAKFPTIVAAFHRIRSGQDPVAPRQDLSHAGNFLYMLNAEEPDPVEEEAMNVALVLHADHGFNASTFSARTTSATLADFYAAITSAVGTLSGPLHGGANQEVLKMLKEIETVDNAEPYIQKKLENKEKIMGFGHRVYNTLDPRARILKKWSRKLGERAGETRWYEMSTKVEELMKDALDIDPNVDFYSASTYHSLGISDDLFTPIFAISRVAGWTANLFEQMADNRLIRPLCDYVGPKSAEYVPIEQRS